MSLAPKVSVETTLGVFTPVDINDPVLVEKKLVKFPLRIHTGKSQS